METKPRLSLNHNSDTVILLLHGFSSSVHEFDGLIKKLDENKINYYAPILTGFGLADVDLLCRIKYQDWIRDTENAYQLLRSKYKNVLVAGHSAGGALSMWLASKYHLPAIFITSPYVQIKNGHTYIHKLTRSSLLFDLIKLFHPIVSKSKTKNNKGVKRFVFDAVPLAAVKAVWDLTEVIDFKDLNETDVCLFTSVKDNTVIEADLLDLFNRSGIKYKHRSYEASGHNILEDAEKEAVVQELAEDLVKRVKGLN